MSWQHYTGYYVYTYLDANSKPYYVGMGKGNRMIKKHLYVQVPLFENIIVIDNLTQQEAWNKEIDLISLYGREIMGTGPLKNLAPGGPTQKSGWNQSIETRTTISEKNTGKVRTAEHKKNYSKPKTAEHAEKVRQAVTAMWADPEYRTQRLKKIQETPFAHKGKPWSPARREAQMKKQNKEITV